MITKYLIMPLWLMVGGAIQLNSTVVESNTSAVTLVGGLEGAEIMIKVCQALS